MTLTELKEKTPYASWRLEHGRGPYGVGQRGWWLINGEDAIYLAKSPQRVRWELYVRCAEQL